MSVYVAVAEAESFAAAARKLNISPPAVTRAIASLERRLGVPLLTRTTRFVRATDAGLRYLEHARRILTDAKEADEAIAGTHAPSGQLAVTAPVLFGRMFVVPGIVEYLRRYPDVSVSAVLLDRIVNLLEEGMDVGIRIGALADSSMRAIGVGHVGRVVCAAPAYLKAHGTPKAPRDLMRHVLIASAAVSQTTAWRFVAGKKAVSVNIRPRLTVTNNDAAIAAAVQGFGVTRLLSYQAAHYVAAGQLKVVLADYETVRLPIHLLHREGRHAQAKVRTFIDLLAARLQSDKALN